MIPIATLPPTVRLYREDAYRKTSTGRVLYSEGLLLVLDQTVFYPGSGGQTCDRGSIAGLTVTGVRQVGGTERRLPNGETTRVDTVIVHELSEPLQMALPPAGTVVEQQIDWSRRYHNMQMHSLAHFLFHAACEYFDRTGQQLGTKGAHIDGDTARFDFVGSVGADDVPDIESRVRGLVAEAEEATIDRLADGVVIWRSGEIAIPCGGTHVRQASEIQGRLSVRRRSKGSGLTRLYVTLDRAA